MTGLARLAMPVMPAALVLVLCSASCTVESDVFTDIGTTRLTLVSGAVRPQSVVNPDSTVQTSRWDLQQAELDLDGVLLDLLGGGTCTVDHVAGAFPVSQGRCQSGLIIDSNVDARPISLHLRFTMEQLRAEPVDLPPMSDGDGDGVANSVDNCPLLPNPDQEDSDLDGTGNACSILTAGGFFLRDSDGDGINDNVDNCVGIYNPDQADTLGLAAQEIIPFDGIGDACNENAESADVLSGGGSEVEIALTLDEFVQPLNGATFLTVYFDGDAVSCDWNAGMCDLDPSLVRLCATTSAFESILGCE